MILAKIIQPDIILFGLRIQEPMVVLTDIILGLVCFYAYRKLPNSGSRANRFMNHYFLLFGLSVIAGGIVGHGFMYALDFSWKLAGWIPAIFSVALLEFAALEYARPGLSDKTVKVIGAMIMTAMLVVTGLTMYFINFKFVEVHSAFGIVLVFLPLHIYNLKRSGNEGSRNMIYAVLVLISTLFVFRIPIVIHTYFNHIDLVHIIMCVAVLLMLKGAALLNEAPGN
ncbi:MAG: hypothetical protein DRI69_04475 [Bacteroidetes bacterium]|nr:MAG: hypothetical protein DRI69_04475 [Bacteroidota bacterium]